MAQFPYLPLFTDAYIADTMHLDCMESGAYLHLLIAAWRSPDCNLPDDDKMLARMAKCSPRQWVKVRGAVMAFWTLSEHKWSQKRLLNERVYVTAKRDQQSQAGKASALKRLQSSSTDVVPPLATDGQQPILTPIPTPIEGKKKKEVYTAPVDAGDFDSFWVLYPRKLEKKAARKAYQTALKTASPEDLLTGLTAYCEEIIRNRTETRFIKHCTTWLNQGCHEDDHTEIIHPGGSNQGRRSFAEIASETISRMERG